MSLHEKTLSLCCSSYIHSYYNHSHNVSSLKLCYTTSYPIQNPQLRTTQIHMPNSPLLTNTNCNPRRKLKPLSAAPAVPPPLDLTENNVRQALVDARAELGQIFDTSVGMTGIFMFKSTIKEDHILLCIIFFCL